MGFPTKIGYCHGTFSPWFGCAKVSPGCDHCFAERWAKRTGIIEWGPGKPRRLASERAWDQPLIWDERAAKAGTRYRVLTDLCDVFDTEAPESWRYKFASLIIATPNLDWLVLTKRPHVAKAFTDCALFPESENIWLGISVSTQAEADEKIPILLSVPASKHWVSIEPMLEGIDLELSHGCRSCNHPGNIIVALNEHGRCSRCDGTRHEPSGIDWIVCGGETGPGARPMHPDWVRSLRDQCQEAGVAFWFKAWGSRETTANVDYRHTEKAGGNLLDGRKWEQVPK